MNSTPDAGPSPTAAAARSGGCCCGMGCLSLFVVMLAAVALLVGGAWYFYAKTIDALTAPAPVAVLMETPSDAQSTAASQKFDQIRTAAVTQQSQTVEFTAPELNALFARHPSFSEWRGKTRIEIADSILTFDLSVPLREVALPRVKDRWFNGTIRFSMAYDQDRFALGVKSLSANGHDIDLTLFNSMADKINEGFNEGFDQSQRDDPRANEFWENVDSMEVRGDRLIITTKGAQAAGSGSTV